jgi:hypothetical protein
MIWTRQTDFRSGASLDGSKFHRLATADVNALRCVANIVPTMDGVPGNGIMKCQETSYKQH